MHTHIWVCVLSRLEVQAKETGRTSRNSPMPGPRPGLCPDKLTLNEAVGASDGGWRLRGVAHAGCGLAAFWGLLATRWALPGCWQAVLALKPQ